jgi:choline dehydrogenase
LQAAGMEYLASHTGPLSYPAQGGSTHAFQKLSPEELQVLNATELFDHRQNQSHIEYYWEPSFFPALPTPEYAPRKNESYFSLTAGLLAPVAQGNVSLQSNQIGDYPLINLNYLGAETDQKIAVESFKRLRKILAQPQMQEWTIGPNGGEVSPGPSVQTDEDILK